MYSVQESEDPNDPVQYPAQKLRRFLYYKVVVSCSPSKRARVSDDRWTEDTLTWETGYRDALYNSEDGLFYMLSFDGSMLTLNLSSPSSPVAKDIMPEATVGRSHKRPRGGDLMQVWRLKEITRTATAVEVPAEVAVAHEVDIRTRCPAPKSPFLRQILGLEIRRCPEVIFSILK